MRIAAAEHSTTWTFDRPEKTNGFDEATIAMMEDGLNILDGKRDHMACLCICGHQDVFSTGLDDALLETCFQDRDRFAAVVERHRRVVDRLEALPFVTIACVDGTCRLGGLELALACDLIIVGTEARIRDGHLAYDAMPGAGGTNRLPARLGYHGALHLILASPELTGQEALDRGLADELSPAGQAHVRGTQLASALSGHAPSLIRDIKASLRAARPAVADRFYAQAFQRSVIDRLIPAAG